MEQKKIRLLELKPNISSDLDEVWKYFDQHLKGDQEVVIIDHQQKVETPHGKIQNPFTAMSTEKLVNTEEVEFILTYPT